MAGSACSSADRRIGLRLATLRRWSRDSSAAALASSHRAELRAICLSPCSALLWEVGLFLTGLANAFLALAKPQRCIQAGFQ
jgi:hypothetical protein